MVTMNDLRQSIWINNFSLSYGIYNHNHKAYEWTKGRIIQISVSNWDLKEPYSLINLRELW